MHSSSMRVHDDFLHHVVFPLSLSPFFLAFLPAAFSAHRLFSRLLRPSFLFFLAPPLASSSPPSLPSSLPPFSVFLFFRVRRGPLVSYLLAFLLMLVRKAPDIVPSSVPRAFHVLSSFPPAGAVLARTFRFCHPDCRRQAGPLLPRFFLLLPLFPFTGCTLPAPRL